uniref:GOLD domain-containing protein n=2 Tax=Spongospora subterranea TaxID=70186 RepID=A0A0H5R4E4_9EUKA|eukprot:CRZ09080.1 hypothetical protein [Spongospora subterranea]
MNTQYVLLVCVIVPTLIHGFNIIVPGSGTVYFLEQVEPGERVHQQFHVYVGGLRDIDFKIFDPNGKPIYEASRVESEGTEFIAQVGGEYKFQFTNSISTVTDKFISVTTTVGNKLQEKDVAKAEHLSKLEESVVMLGQSIRSVADEQKYLKVRERVASNTNQSTNSRVLWWGVIETIVIIGVSLWKTYHIRGMFETKRYQTL